MIRESRKVQHIEHFLATAGQNADNGFGDVHLVHDALSNHSLDDISLSTHLSGIKLNKPVIINAITGGDDKVFDINRRLAICARKTGLAMAVGSQYAAIKNPDVRSSYEIVRQENPDGIIFANLGAYATVEHAREAVAMIDAQAIQIHLNIAQELYMQEGDRDFKHYLDNIKRIAENVDLPVIVKETGCGISYEVAKELVGAGVKIIDVSGKGGTNFIAIETSRTQTILDENILNWGLSSAASTYEAVKSVAGNADIISSGGISNGLEAVKAFALGAKATAIAGPFLKNLLNDGEEVLCQQIESFLQDIKRFILLTGCACIEDVSKKQPVFKGLTREWLEARGFDLNVEKKI